jgi:hypothetical protein
LITTTMGNVSVSGISPMWRGGGSECTDDSESWDCYLRDEPPCDASELTISTASSRTTSTSARPGGIALGGGGGGAAVRSTRATRSGHRSKRSKSMGSTTRKNSKPTQLLRAQELLVDEVRQLRTELDSAKVLLGKQEGLEQRIVELERLTKHLQGNGTRLSGTKETADNDALENAESAATSLPVYAVAATSL